MTFHSCLYCLDVLHCQTYFTFITSTFSWSPCPSHRQYLELSAGSSFPRCPQFSPFHASPGVGSWGIRNACAVLVWAVSWLASGELARWALLPWLGLYSGHQRNFSSLAPWKFSQYLIFLNLLFSVKVEAHLMNSRDVLEARWWGKMTVCSCKTSFSYEIRLKWKCSQHECVKTSR